jgi:hypothetical protein
MVTRAEGLGWAGLGWGTEIGSDDDGRMMMGMMMTKQLFAIVGGMGGSWSSRALQVGILETLQAVGAQAVVAV